MSVDENTVRRIARLAHIALKDEEVAPLAKELSTILDWVEQLNELDTAAVEPLAHCLPLHNVLRPDEVRESLGTEKTLANAPQQDGAFFQVPKILEEGSA